MNEEKLGQEPAFATSAALSRNEDIYQAGINKRFYAACAAMQGLLSSGMYTDGIAYNLGVAEFAFKLADDLLEQEKK